ncbi:MAG: tRNA pseudouridine55 synthase [Patescibacteria group bacterium]|nr:tRNA pseudouridine55 synthase [Patescibacteria group bacterium]
MKKPEDILLINKPKGITSFDVIRILRKKMGIRKMGHAGTLDPLASGLMIIGVESGTKKLGDYIKLDKSYVADILLGRETTTGDMEGEIVKEAKVLFLEEDYIKELMNAFHGDFELLPPIYSAIKKDGKPLYKYARSGEEVEVLPRVMKVYKSKFLGSDKVLEGFTLRVSFDVASGVYIRSLVMKIGELLGVPATLYDLKRTKIGEFDLKNSVDL